MPLADTSWRKQQLRLVSSCAPPPRVSNRPMQVQKQYACHCYCAMLCKQASRLYVVMFCSSDSSLSDVRASHDVCKDKDNHFPWRSLLIKLWSFVVTTIDYTCMRLLTQLHAYPLRLFMTSSSHQIIRPTALLDRHTSMQ